MTVRDQELLELLGDQPDLLAIADALAVTQHPACLGELSRRSRRRPVVRLTLRLVIAIALFLLLAGLATATYLVLHRPSGQPHPGALTVAAGGADSHAADIIDEVMPNGLTTVAWRCPANGWCGELTSFDWSPDGRHLAFTLDEIGANSPYVGLHIVDPRTGHDFHVTPLAGRRLGCELPGVRWDSVKGVAWSPDSRTLAFTCSTGLHTIRSDGTHTHRLPTGSLNGSWATWSPDGKRIAFQAVNATTCCSIYVMGLDGSDRVRIARGGSEPDWSPDGKTIAYRAVDGIRFVTPAGVDVTPTGASLKPRGTPAWSPDGSMLAVATRRGVFLIPATGGHARLATRAGSTPGFGPVRPDWSPTPIRSDPNKPKHVRPSIPTCGAC